MEVGRKGRGGKHGSLEELSGGVFQTQASGGDRRHRDQGQRWPNYSLESDQQSLRRHFVSGEPETAQRAGYRSLPEHWRGAAEGGSGGDRDARSGSAGTHG